MNIQVSLSEERARIISPIFTHHRQTVRSCQLHCFTEETICYRNNITSAYISLYIVQLIQLINLLRVKQTEYITTAFYKLLVVSQSWQSYFMNITALR
jgi:hypothetical protein